MIIKLEKKRKILKLKKYCSKIYDSTTETIFLKTHVYKIKKNPRYF